MRILIQGINFSPELTGIGKYTGEMAQWLAGHGHQVRVVTAPPYYPQWQVQDGYSAWRYRKQSLHNLTVWRCPVWVPARPRGLTRILHLASFALSALPVMVRQIVWKPDVVMTVAPPLFCAPAAWLTARLSGARAMLHIQDFEVDAAFSLGLLRSGLFKRLALGFERLMLRRFDQVSTISEAMRARLHAKGLDPARCRVLPNWVDCEVIHPLAEQSPLRAGLRIEQAAIIVLYSGNLGEKQGLETVIAAAAVLERQREFMFVFCGEGSARLRLQQQTRHMSNIRWLPLQPHDDLNGLLNLATIHVLPQRAGAADLVMPSKLTAMLASGRPVIATVAANTEVATLLQGCGECVAPGDARALADMIIHLAGQPALRAAMGQQARQRAVAMFDKSTVLTDLERLLAE
ncbi:MAG: glycosyltransferase WbuB [Gammaproteobacteria bacterium]|nr:glycosyltransferase WbuB [Gammaproteobacteria bacterium]